MIYDCFIFFNELELLDIRLNTLNDVVDKFVICESTVTHTNKPKPLYFAENREKFKKFKDKIIYIKVDDSPNTNIPWILIDYQWSAIEKGLRSCKPSDIILLSDLDEIPRPEKILEWKNKPGKIKAFMQTFSYYYLNCVDYADGKWEGGRMVRYKDLMKYRLYASRFTIPDVRIPDGGWHFSYMGGIKRIQQKLATTGHQEFNTEKYKTAENISMAIAEGKDFLNHGLKFKIMDKSFLPRYVLANELRFKDFIIEKFEKQSFIYPIKKVCLKIINYLRLLYRKFRNIYISKLF